MANKIFHIDIDEIEIKRIFGRIQEGLENPSNPAAIALARINFKTLCGYALCPYCHGNGCDNCEGKGHLV